MFCFGVGLFDVIVVYLFVCLFVLFCVVLRCGLFCFAFVLQTAAKRTSAKILITEVSNDYGYVGAPTMPDSVLRDHHHYFLQSSVVLREPFPGRIREVRSPR